MTINRTSFLLVATLLATGIITNYAHAADSDKSLESGETATKQLLMLMDKDANGKVSKREFMSFMESEFDRLDKNKNQELDVEELSHIYQYRSVPGPHK